MSGREGDPAGLDWSIAGGSRGRGLTGACGDHVVVNRLLRDGPPPLTWRGVSTITTGSCRANKRTERSVSCRSVQREQRNGNAIDLVDDRCQGCERAVCRGVAWSRVTSPKGIPFVVIVDTTTPPRFVPVSKCRRISRSFSQRLNVSCRHSRKYKHHCRIHGPQPSFKTPTVDEPVQQEVACSRTQLALDRPVHM